MRVELLGKFKITVGGYRFVHPIYVGHLQNEMLFSMISIDHMVRKFPVRQEH